MQNKIKRSICTAGIIVNSKPRKFKSHLTFNPLDYAIIKTQITNKICLKNNAFIAARKYDCNLLALFSLNFCLLEVKEIVKKFEPSDPDVYRDDF